MEEIDLKEILKMIWNKKIVIIGILILFFLLGFFYTYFMVAPKYESSTTLVLAKKDSDDASQTTSITQNDVTINQKLVSTYSELAKSNAVIREVLGNLKITDMTEEALKKKVSVTSVKDTELIKITVTSENAIQASEMANEMAKVFTKKIAEIYNMNNVHVVDQAEISADPSNINHIKDIAVFVLIGFVVSFATVLMSNLFDTTVKTAEQIEKQTGLLILSQIPECGKEQRGRGRK